MEEPFPTFNPQLAETRLACKVPVQASLLFTVLLSHLDLSTNVQSWHQLCRWCKEEMVNQR